jgi:hypothetical protein
MALLFPNGVNSAAFPGGTLAIDPFASDGVGVTPTSRLAVI